MADGGGLENRYGVTPIVGSNPTPSARSTVPDTPPRTTTSGVTEPSMTVFPQVDAPLVDKAAVREVGHQPLSNPLATIG